MGFDPRTREKRNPQSPCSLAEWRAGGLTGVIRGEPTRGEPAHWTKFDLPVSLLAESGKAGF